MSTAKRSRARQAEAGAAPSLPPSKKAKTTQQSSGLSFLTDENQRAGRKLRADYTNAVKNSSANRVDESKAQVEHHEADAPELVEISSDEESSAYSGSDDEDKDTKPTTNGTNDADATMADAGEEMDDAAVEGQSFGDMLQAAHPETIDVQSAFADREQGTSALVPMNQDRSLTVPTATSLGTVLTQALRTNDRDLLETCFQMTDIPSIRSTIQRLQSPLVASLLQRLAERLHKRPGRAGNLMVWVQWSLVSHGGYLASQPDVLKKLKTLSRVIKERANGLQSLVTLKGKLDMLNAQIDLRKTLQETREGRFDDPDNEDRDVIYVEGEEDESSDEDENDLISNAVGSDLGDVSMVNGADQDSSDVEEEEAGEGMFDDEAEETSDDEGEELSDDDDESDEVEEEEEDDESSSDDEAPAPVVKPSRPQQRAAGRRR